MYFKFKKLNKGFTYVELIVVLAITTILSSISLFNYQTFQNKVDMKNLSNSVALKITEMQKFAIAGKRPVHTIPVSGWKPSYGIYFPAITPTTNKTFYLFADLLLLGAQDKKLGLTTPCPGTECMSVFTIGKGNYIEKIDIKYQNGTTVSHTTPLHITYTRPNVGAAFWSDTSQLSNVDYIEVSLRNSNNSASAKINIYASGRVQII